MDCFIGEKRQAGEGRASWEKLSPRDESPLFSVKEASPQQVQEALSTAQKAFHEWSQLPVNRRAECLKRLADLIERDQDSLARMEATETGRAIREIYSYDIPVTIESLRYYSGLIENECPSLEKSPSLESEVRYEPFGICFGIGAWNYPLQIAA